MTEKKTLNHYLRKYYYGLLYWMFLNIWCRYFYRHVMKIMHKFNLHYTVEAMPHEIIDTAISCGKLMKKRHLWCQWRGLRGDVLKFENENQ